MSVCYDGAFPTLHARARVGSPGLVVPKEFRPSYLVHSVAPHGLWLVGRIRTSALSPETVGAIKTSKLVEGSPVAT
jgi:hypothetical protein